MRTEIIRNFRFEAAHHLPNVPEGHKCARLHGHSYRVSVAVAGEVDDELGWIVDFAEIDECWRPLHAVLDHYYLNEVEGLSNPTAELLARWIYERLELPAKAKLVSVAVHETCTAGAIFYG